uniref:Uncharacterized protein n=1 Tax=Panthera leo TaxID=9689 RepID=A0A8C9DA46_PANLE
VSFLLPKLTSKKEEDQAIKSTAEKALVLRFGRDEDPVCLQYPHTYPRPHLFLHSCICLMLSCLQSLLSQFLLE